MFSRKRSPNAFGSSSISKRGGQSKICCSCGKDVVIRTARQGPNLRIKFYGCPLWLVNKVQILV
ncbi:DNA topoisomerase 3-alpha [Bienertia sinuspersici]